MHKVVANATARVARFRIIDFVVFICPLISYAQTRFSFEFSLFVISFAIPTKDLTCNGGDLGYQRLQQNLRVALPGKAGTLSGPELKEFRPRIFLGNDDKVFHEAALQGIRENLHSWAIEFFE